MFKKWKLDFTMIPNYVIEHDIHPKNKKLHHKTEKGTNTI